MSAGLCVGMPSGLECVPSSGKSVDAIVQSLSQFTDAAFVFANGTNSQPDVRDAVSIGLQLQSQIFLWILVMSGILFVIGFVLAIIEFLRRKRRTLDNTGTVTQGQLKKWAITIYWTSTALASAATVGIVQATSSLEFLSNVSPSNLLVTKGIGAEAVHCSITALTILYILVRTKIFKSRSLDEEANPGTYTRDGDVTYARRVKTGAASTAKSGGQATPKSKVTRARV
jgi:hypothetical protein